MANKGNALEICQEHFNTDVEDLRRLNIPEQTVQRVIRIRTAYAHWIQAPLRKDKEIVLFLCQAFDIKKSAAYSDLIIIKDLLGRFNRVSKDFHLYKLNAMIDEAWQLAKAKKNEAALAPIIDKYGKYNQLDKSEEELPDWEDMKVQPFVPTSDPSVLGIKPMPNKEQKIKELLNKYGAEVEDVNYIENEFTNPEEYNE